jgi:hypothetical protein
MKKTQPKPIGKQKGDNRYNSRTMAIAKVLYVDECKTLEQISNHFGGKPAKSTIEKLPVREKRRTVPESGAIGAG